MPADLPTLAHEDSKAYGESFELIHRRDAEGPNAIWKADHTPLDILVLWPDGRAANPWLTVVIDDYSRAMTGYFLSFEAPCSLHTSLALRQAIWRKGDSRWVVCGIPDVLYTDNGTDFTSRHLEQVGADLKIRLVFSIPGRPRGRGRIERFFSTVNEMFLCELDGYAPPGGKMRGKPTLTLEEIDAEFRTLLLDDYHREHSETKERPVERWEADGFLPRMPDSLEPLDLQLIRVARSRQVRADGIYFQLEKCCVPSGVNLPKQPLASEAVAAIIRVAAGKFRLPNRLLTQIERILEVNSLREVPKSLVEAGRESMVIGEA